MKEKVQYIGSFYRLGNKVYFVNSAMQQSPLVVPMTLLTNLKAVVLHCAVPLIKTMALRIFWKEISFALFQTIQADSITL